MKIENCKLEIGSSSEFGVRNSFVIRFRSAGSFVILLLSLLWSAGSAYPQTAGDKNSTFFMGRIKYSSNDGNDCSHVGEELMSLVSRASTLKLQEERRLKFTDPELFETPFVFMNGHNSFILTEAEVANLRKYLSHYFCLGLLHEPELSRGVAPRIRPDFSKRASQAALLRPFDLSVILQD